MSRTVAVLFLAAFLSSSAAPVSAPSLLRQYCFDCHDEESRKGDLDLASIAGEDLRGHPELWERVIRKVSARQMPPPEKKRPSEGEYEALLSQLAGGLDRAAAAHPNPGRTETFRRLNRTEYQNAIRDLLDLQIDATALLPKEDAGHGFDNVTVGTLSPTLLDRYISAAQKISRLAVGAPMHAEIAETIRIPADVTQEEQVEGLPPGTRGGTLFTYNFPHDAEYDFQMRLTRDRNEEVEGLHESHEMQLLVDNRVVESFTVSPPRGHKDYDQVDQHLKARVAIEAGRHNIGITFVKKGSSLLETKRQPYNAHFNMHRHPRQNPALYQVSITGPHHSKGPGATPSRRRIFVCRPGGAGEEERCATNILTRLMRRAYRGPISASDLEAVMRFYREGATEGGFENGIQNALTAILVSPKFLFRVEEDPAGASPGTVYAVSDLDLASRLSFFIWSSIPDEELLDRAARGELHRREVLEREARRMLADPRAFSLVNNFAAQWLHLRNLDSLSPDMRLFPDFDDNLRQAMRKETELLVGKILQEDRSVLELLDANYTFANERLARHYGIPHVCGSRFRLVPNAEEFHRGGLLRQGSILAVTSYATRTSPVIRGDWILKNVVGTPTPPPPPNVPTLDDAVISERLTLRDRLALHRANAACAGCHKKMDPVGFALENFDAVGRWRTLEEEKPVDSSGGLPDGSKVSDPRGLEEALLKHPDLFAETVTEKLLIFGLGRGVEYYDMPAVRKIVAGAREQDYRLSSLIVGIVQSTPFTMRKSL